MEGRCILPFCKDCGYQLGEEFKFCPQCGASNVNISQNQNLISRLLSPDEAGVQNQFAISRLNLPRTIYELIELSPSGNSLYLTQFREKLEYTSYFDLIYYDTKTAESKSIADVGSHGSYLSGFIGDLYFKSVSVEGSETFSVLCFDKGNEVTHSINDIIIEHFLTYKDRIIIKKDYDYFSMDKNGKQKQLNLENAYDGLRFCCHPNRNIAIASKQDIAEKLMDYFFVEFDDDFNVTKEDNILSETIAKKYSRFTGWTSTQILFTEQTDTNDDGIADYKDKRSSTIKSLNLETLQQFSEETRGAVELISQFWR